jgi:hypothetical protein
LGLFCSYLVGITLRRRGMRHATRTDFAELHAVQTTIQLSITNTRPPRSPLSSLTPPIQSGAGWSPVSHGQAGTSPGWSNNGLS